MNENMDNLKRKIKGVLNLAPNLSDVEVWNALLRKHRFSNIRNVMEEIDEEMIKKRDRLTNAEPNIQVSGNISLDKVIENTEKKKKEAIEAKSRED